MSRTAPERSTRRSELRAAAQPDRRALIGWAGGFCVCACCARAGEIEPEAYVEYDEPIDVRGVAPGDWTIVHIEGQPIFVRHRTPEEIAAVRSVPLGALPDPARDEDRAPEGEWIVVSGACTHEGCTVSGGLGPYQGWLCLCHGSIYDLSGRVRHGPAKKNLAVVQHRFSSPSEMVLVRA